MGIPGFFKWLSERYPDIIETTNPRNKVVSLYLDINALFHVALHKKQVKKKGPGSPRRMLSEVFGEMDYVIESCSPQFVYIAMDGVAPKAKMNEQRSRRYTHQNDNINDTSGNSSSNINGSDNFEFFVPINSVAITAGTDFMTAANNAIRFYIYQRLNGKYKALQIIFNDSKVPGEGEHKIFRYLNTQRYDPNNRHVVYGSDADFIMYALLTHKHNICILRSGNNGDYKIVNVHKLRKHILADMVGGGGGVGGRKIDGNNLIDDFACLVNLLGNDFMPRLKHVGEASCLQYVCNLNPLVKSDSLISENLGEETLENRANDYLKTMLWSVLYHNGSCPSWRFSYSYHKSPTMNEILKYVNPRIFNPSFTSDFPMNPFEQLVYIIPPSTSYLLPESLRDLLTDPESPLKDFLPKNYPTKGNGTATLPFIDEKILIESVQERYQYIDENDLKRNSLDGKVHIFSGCKSKTYSIIYPLCTSFDGRMTIPDNSIILGKLNHDGCMLETIKTPVNGWNDIRNNSVAFAEYNLLNQTQ
nr:7145_t:CDS:2 [Entrophospora candida]